MPYCCVPSQKNTEDFDICQLCMLVEGGHREFGQVSCHCGAGIIHHRLFNQLLHVTGFMYHNLINYRGADKSLGQPGRKQATVTEDFDFHISYL